MNKRKTLTDTEKEYLADRYNPEELIDILDLDTSDLVEYLEELIVDELDKFELPDNEHQTEEEVD